MKPAPLPFGKKHIEVLVPESAEVRGCPAKPPLGDPHSAVLRALKRPIGTPPLSELARGKKDAVIVVSDHTRPVPYAGPSGILLPLLSTLRKAGPASITILVACGTHRPMKEEEHRAMLGEEPFERGIPVINHSADDRGSLAAVTSTTLIPQVTVNRRYLTSECKILTGLIEPHFMAGFSGGRKSICPGLCGRNVTETFHSAQFLENRRARSLVLEGNPCHEAATEVARKAGADFILNVTIDRTRRITGVFAGDLQKAFQAGVKEATEVGGIQIFQEYDLVVTGAADVGANHYQCAKAAIEASRVVKRGGAIVLAADLTEPDPVGGGTYRELLKLLREQGADAFRELILSEGWSFMPDQWEVQMWARVFTRLGSAERFFTCAPQLEAEPADSLPEVNVAARINRLPCESDSAYARRMVQATLTELLRENPQAHILVLPDGPYGVPRPHTGSTLGM